MTSANVFVTDVERWNALMNRDPLAADSFVYGVKTTGVYCRPTCSSRLPKQGNVDFFARCGQAERRGYRACKKCKPNVPGSSSLAANAVVGICKMIEDADELPSLAELAHAAGLSPFYFHRLFKKIVGVTPRAYGAACRVKRFQTRLRTEHSVTKAIYGAGFGSSSRCYEKASHTLGMTPSEYRNGAVGQSIRFAVVECFLGRMIVAATERGICLIEFGDEPDDLRAVLTTRFPKADLLEGDSAFLGWVGQVVAYIETPRSGFSLPLDIQGTVFQRKVWEALQTIPVGTTATYADIARQIGKPTAVRAVARACAANKLAVAIPCHRVVRADGDLSGYRWGVPRKRKLLEREAELNNGDDRPNAGEEV
jgi:AraC family transcriptional regulator of adaptative response/methylated-DNA-[protein]-cysteine methyltransferase